MEALPQFASVLRDRNFIAGRWSLAQDGRTFSVVDPASGERVAEIPDSGAADARAAVEAAAAALPAWREKTAAERARVLKRWHALILERAEALAWLMTLEQGKPLRESRARSLSGRATSNGSRRKRAAPTAT
jgi:succinate-semialdehyde dehydrogenase/glutarate-semialdehyde dehydrogenase